MIGKKIVRHLLNLLLLLVLPVLTLSAINFNFENAFDIGGEPGFVTIQDRDGFLWFTSFYNGMVRFDGSDRKLVQVGENGISNNFVTQIFEDNKGQIWAGTNYGLNRYDKNTNSVTIFYKDPETPKSSLAGNIFNLSSKTIIQDKDGQMWFGTQSGLSKYDEENNIFINFQHNPEDSNSLSGNDIYCVFEDSQGLIWVATKDHGVNSLNPETGEIVRFIHYPEFPGLGINFDQTLKCPEPHNIGMIFNNRVDR